MAENSFEDKMLKLNAFAKKLEEGGVPLSESLELYREAVETAKEMRDELDMAKGSVTLMQKGLDGELIETEVPEYEL